MNILKCYDIFEIGIIYLRLNSSPIVVKYNTITMIYIYIYIL